MSIELSIELIDYIKMV